MAVPRIVIDGPQVYGTTTGITLGGQVVIFNTLTIDRNVTEAVQNDAAGRPRTRRSTEGVATFSGEAQINPGDTYPKHGDQVTFTVDPNYGAETFLMNPVGQSQTNGAGDVRVLNVTGAKVLNPGQVTTVL